jgi:hypothetical protein
MWVRKLRPLLFSVLPSEAHPKLDLVEPWYRLLVNSSDFNLNRCRMLFRGLTILTSNLYGTLWRKMAQVIGRISRLG